MFKKPLSFLQKLHKRVKHSVKHRRKRFTIPNNQSIIKTKGTLYINGKRVPANKLPYWEEKISDLNSNEVLSLVFGSLRFQASLHILNEVTKSEDIAINRAILHTIDLIEDEIGKLNS